MDRTTALMLLAVLVTGLEHAFTDGTWPNGLTIPASWRAVLVTVLGIVAGCVDSVMNGVAWKTAVSTALAASGPALVVLLLKAIGGNDAGGNGSSTVGKPLPPLVAPGSRPPPPYSAAFAWTQFPGSLVVASVLCVAMAFGAAAGCKGGFPQFLEDVMQGTEDVTAIISALEAALPVFFAQHPNLALEQEIDQKLQDVALSADTVLRVARGAKDVSDADLGKAQADFTAAWNELEALLKSVGVSAPAPAGSIALRHGSTGVFRRPLLAGGS